jgi:hypothetical protein
MPLNETKSELAKSEKAPMSDASGSVTPSKDRKNDSVLDFLYHDIRRVASFLAQFETYGLLQQVKATESVGHSGTSRTTHSAGVDLVTIAKAGVAIDGTVADDERDSAERTYDPLWTNARTLMDYLHERGMIQRDIRRARIGQFILLSGKLSVIDSSLLRHLWQSKAVLAHLLQNQKSGKGKQALTDQQKHTQLTMEILPTWPHKLQAIIDGDGFSAWSGLADDGLIGTGADIALKHGYEIPGTWHALGILDAEPGAAPAAFPLPEVQVPEEQALENMRKLAKNLSVGVRKALGRPADKYGFTALLIFREVSG